MINPENQRKSASKLPRTQNEERRTRTWVETWRKAAVSLKEIKKKELRDPNYYNKNLDITDKMLQYACDNLKGRPHSGLVEQQKIFKRMKRQKESVTRT